MNRKYKQKTIPEILTSSLLFKGLSRAKLNLFVSAFYEKNLRNKTITNLHTGYEIKITRQGVNKITKGSSLYPFKAIVLIKLLELIKYAEFSNFGPPKESDPKELFCYVNFKVKCRIDKKIQHFRISCKVDKNGRIFYNHEKNKEQKAV